jgi:ADP-ribose pyrophosphatase
MTNIKPWQILESHITYQDKYIKLRTDRCLSSRGNIVEKYHVLEYNDWVNVIVLTPNFDCVVLHEYRHGIGGVRLGFPSGGVEDNETDFLSTIKREVLEETGYSSEIWLHTSSVDANPAMQTNQLHSFLAINAAPINEQDLDETEDIEVSLIPFTKVLGGMRTGVLSMQSLYVVALWAAFSKILQGEFPILEPLRLELIKELKL